MAKNFKIRASKYPRSKKSIESPNVITKKRGDAQYGELGSQVHACWTDHRDAHGDFLDQFVTDDAMYLCNPDVSELQLSKVKDSQSNTFVMETFRDVESVWSSVEQMIFGDQPFFEALPGSLSDSVMDKVITTETALENAFSDMRFRPKFAKFGRGLCLNGTGIAEVPWTYITRQVRNAEGGYDKASLIDCQDFIPVPLVRFAFQPGSTCIEDADWVIKSFEMGKDALANLIYSAEKVGGEVRQLKDLEDSGELPEKTYNTKSSTGDINEYTDEIQKNRGYRYRYKNERIKGLDYWGKNPDDPNDPRDWRIVIVGDGAWVIKMPNKYNHGRKPFLRGTYIEQQDSFYGIGMGQILKRPQIQINHFRNLARDVAKMQAYSMWMQQGTMTNRSGNLKYSPNKILPVHEWGMLTPLRPPIEALDLIMKLETIDKEDMRYSTSATNIAQALPTGGTATETKVMASESARRIAGIAQSIAEQVIKPFFSITIDNIKQFRSESFIVKKITSEGVQYEEKGIDALMEKPNFRIRLATDIDFREKIQRRLTSVLQTLAQVGEAVPEYKVEIMPLVKSLVKSFGVDPREVVSKKPPAPEQPVQEQQVGGKPSPSQPLPSGGEQPPAEGAGLPINQVVSPEDAPNVMAMKNRLVAEAIKAGIKNNMIPPENMAKAKELLARAEANA